MQTEYPYLFNARRSKNCVSIDRQNCFTKSVKQARKNIWTRRKTPLRASAWAVACYGTLFANMCIICEYLEMIWLVFRSILPILFPVKHTKNTRSAHNSPGNTKLTLRRRFDTPKNRCHSLRPARLIKSTPKLSRRPNSQAKRTQHTQTVVIRRACRCRRTRTQPRNRNRDDRQVNAHNKHAKRALQNRRHTLHLRAKNKSAICFHNTP